MQRPIRKQIVSQSQRGGFKVAAGRRRGLQCSEMLIGMISSVEEKTNDEWICRILVCPVQLLCFKSGPACARQLCCYSTEQQVVAASCHTQAYSYLFQHDSYPTGIISEAKSCACLMLFIHSDCVNFLFFFFFRFLCLYCGWVVSKLNSFIICLLVVCLFVIFPTLSAPGVLKLTGSISMKSGAILQNITCVMWHEIGHLLMQPTYIN